MIASLSAAIVGILLLAIVLWDAFETILLPRRIGRKIRLTRLFYAATWQVCRGMARRERKPARREAILGFYGPISLLLLLICWASGLILAFALLQFAAEMLASGPREIGRAHV